MTKADAVQRKFKYWVEELDTENRSMVIRCRENPLEARIWIPERDMVHLPDFVSLDVWIKKASERDEFSEDVEGWNILEVTPSSSEEV